MMIFAAILAGGIGSRMEIQTPKQFELVGDKPILIHSIEKFLKVDRIDRIIVSSPKEYMDNTISIIKEYISENERIVVIEGGKRRNDTILNSIDYAEKHSDDGETILITHDAARIFVSPELIEKSIDALKDNDASCPVINAVDVIFETKKEGKITDIPLRKYLVHAQTPQAFKINRFMEIYKALSDEEISKLDEAMALFFFGNGKVGLFEGERSNFKITYPIDMEIAEVYLSHQD